MDLAGSTVAIRRAKARLATVAVTSMTTPIGVLPCFLQSSAMSFGLRVTEFVESDGDFRPQAVIRLVGEGAVMSQAERKKVARLIQGETVP